MTYAFDTITGIHILDKYFVAATATKTVSGGQFLSVSGAYAGLGTQVCMTEIDADPHRVGIALDSAVSGGRVTVVTRGLVRVKTDSGISLTPGAHFVATSGGYVRAYAETSTMTHLSGTSGATGLGIVLGYINEVAARVGMNFTSGTNTTHIAWIDIM